MAEPTRKQLRSWRARAKTLNDKAIELFVEIDATDADEHLLETASDSMTSTSGLRTALDMDLP